MEIAVEISNERFVSLTVKLSPSDVDGFVAALLALKLPHKRSFHLNGVADKPPYVDIEIGVEASVSPSDWTPHLAPQRTAEG